MNNLINILLCLIFIVVSSGQFARGAEKQELQVSAQWIEASEVTRELVFTGLVEFKHIYQIVAPADGVVLHSNTEIGMQLPADKELYKLGVPTPGFKDFVINNRFGNIKVLNTVIEQGQFVEKHEVLAYVTPSNKFKAVFKLTAEDLLSIKDASIFELEFFPQTEHAFTEQTKEYQVRFVENSGPFQTIEIYFSCSEDKACSNINLAGAPVKVSIEVVEKQVTKVPTKVLRSGMTELFVLNQDHQVQKKQVQVIKSYNDNTWISSSGFSAGQVIVDFNRLPEIGEIPSKIISQ